ncbi:MAG: fasciclin domain-containing protein [Gammaproteobacteria bacterium]|jgi:uncharacterized surface protein with fasciclin (FAS1) repeats|nr:MAG: hypothetical protein ABS55_07810 [Lautropia sp. SCN 70-15]
MKFTKFVAAALVAGAATVAHAKDIVDTAVGAGSFNTLVKAVQAAGLVETLKGPGPFTVFAPTDEAFAKLPAGTLENLLKDKEALAKVLTYHVVPGKVMAADVKPGEAKTVQGQSVKLSAEGGKVMVDGATVTAADVVASNGVIHVIDKVILPN